MNSVRLPVLTSRSVATVLIEGRVFFIPGWLPALSPEPSDAHRPDPYPIRRPSLCAEGSGP